MSKVLLERQVEESYLSYAMSVIVNRAIPDVRDGLKPVHRRILFSMYDSGFFPNKSFKKSSRVIGDVVGKYHPHGDKAIYDALVRMAQPFSLLHVLITGQGNFGSVDGDSPAAMRYTEVKLSPLSLSLLEDVYSDTVDFKDNYDGCEKEPCVLPAAFPNILVNGVNGVAVGMATNIPPHNLQEVIESTIFRLNNPSSNVMDIINILPGPDFPTGCSLLNLSGVKDAFETGRGTVTLRSKTHFEESLSGKNSIIVDEIPYQVNKSRLIESIAFLVREKKIDGISDIRDESDKGGIRIVIELKKGIDKNIILNNLMLHTSMQIRYSINMMLLDKMQPKLMNILDILDAFLAHRREIVIRRINFLLSKAREKANVLFSLYLAVLNIDEVVSLIRKSSSKEDAAQSLKARRWTLDFDIKEFVKIITGISTFDNDFRLSDHQIDAILNMRLHNLTKLEKTKLLADIKCLIDQINAYIQQLSSQAAINRIIEDELRELIKNNAVERKTIIDYETIPDMDSDSLIPNEDVVVNFTFTGYVKRVLLDNYKSQKRGGRGKISQIISDSDFVKDVFVTKNHSKIFCFSDKAKVYKLKAYQIPQVDPASKGRAVANLLNISDNEKISIILPVDDSALLEDNEVLFVTSAGKIKRNKFSDYLYIPSSGKLAISLKKNDKLVSVLLCKGSDDVLISTKNGKSIRFKVTDVRLFKSRIAEGVRAINLSNEDEVISCSLLNGHVFDSAERDEYLKIPYKQRRKVFFDANYVSKIKTSLDNDLFLKYVQNEQFILTVTENGYGKITSFYEYKTIKRGGSGVVSIVTSKRNGRVVESCVIEPGQHVLLVTDAGQLIRIYTGEIPCIGRNTQGVIMLRTKSNEKVVAVAKINDAEEDGE
ncbi:DNA gyrase subunit A [Anaplasmataceae bacterium AB001_6]|nr:DNA gyrase subunit A [Anaplasmataceae bacterium AB001_6]